MLPFVMLPVHNPSFGFVVKKIKLRDVGNDKIFREVSALSRLNHRFIVRYYSWPHAVVLLIPAGVYAGRGTRRSRSPPHVRTVRYVLMYCICSYSHRASDYVYDGSTLFRFVEAVLRPHTLTSYHSMNIESNVSYTWSFGCMTSEYRSYGPP